MAHEADDNATTNTAILIFLSKPLRRHFPSRCDIPLAGRVPATSPRLPAKVKQRGGAERSVKTLLTLRCAQPCSVTTCHQKDKTD
ncbi:hypothetical protein E2C01_022631 [Portunus trituberculatus]|uniref:Uncharacterized protein n=1 Tax=Portunus trituberculatus TaxID=210409 RepID=A0A5B7E5W3_PORTR|nr:hypothetical protein [Portunus trituberculatus]